MNELCLFFPKISSKCTRQICKKEEIISKLYMIARGHLFPVYGLGNECA